MTIILDILYKDGSRGQIFTYDLDSADNMFAVTSERSDVDSMVEYDQWEDGLAISRTFGLAV